MESSPLTKAHDHARAAAIATQTADTTVAINEHAQAAGEFANASKTTGSIEALRTLRLLEQHHKRLSELLKLPAGPPSQISTDDAAEEGEKEGLAQDDSKTTSPPKESSAVKQKPTAKPPPTLTHQKYSGRNLSSSIASNLASARGIRARYSTQPLTPSVSNDQAPGSLEVRPRREGSSKSKAPGQLEPSRQPSWVPPVIPEDEPPKAQSPKPEQGSPTPSEDGFSRFYSTFGSLINRLSAPLAFAGLPLVAEEPAPSPTPPPAPSEPPQRRSRHKPHSTSAAEPDLSKIYSRAALRALDRDGHGASDSFYVVPTSGHTASYASILNHENKEKRRLAASIHSSTNDDNEDDDDFVDARESQQAAAAGAAPTSPAFRKRLGTKSRSEKDLRNVIEELHLENASLKEVLDKVSKRLHAFELNSQSSHLALAQSLRLQRPGSPLSASSGSGPKAAAGAGMGEEALRRRNRELEEQISDMAKHMESLEQDRLKLQLTLEKYRERWEQLKASAKARRGQQEQAAEGESKK